jgi:hypothetical protein
VSTPPARAPGPNAFCLGNKGNLRQDRPAQRGSIPRKNAADFFWIILLDDPANLTRLRLPGLRDQPQGDGRTAGGEKKVVDEVEIVDYRSEPR